MDEIGIVKSVKGMLAIVTVAGKSACEHCTAGCKISGAEAEIEAVNRVRAHVGQRVRVVVRPYSYLKGSALVYGLPSLALIIGAVIGKELFGRLFTGFDPDLLSALCGFAAFLLSFLAVKVLSSGAEKKTEHKPVIEEILEE